MCVLYAREKINQCGSVEEETEKGTRHMVVRMYAPTQAQRLADEDQEPLDSREFYEAKLTPGLQAERERNMALHKALFYTVNDQRAPADRALNERLASFKKKKKSPKITIS